MAGIFFIQNKNKKINELLIEKSLALRGNREIKWIRSKNFTLAFCDADFGSSGLFESPDFIVIWDGFIFLDETIHTLKNPHLFVKIAIENFKNKNFLFLQQLSGSFVLAIISKNTNEILLARDIAGSRPLYYSLFPFFSFSSNIKSFLWSDLFDLKLNPKAIISYLCMITVPDPLTMFENIYALPPGNYLYKRNSRVKIEPFFSFKNIKVLEKFDENFWADNLRKTLEYTIKNYFYQNENIGAFLSGGHDTTAVVSILNKFLNKSLTTITIGYSGENELYESFNEFKYAEVVAKRINSNHYTKIYSEEEIMRIIPYVIWYLEQPSGDAINSFLASKALSKYANIAFTGTGGDEIFIGSHWFVQYFRILKYVNLWNHIPSAIRNLIRKIFPIKRFNRLDFASKNLINRYSHLKFLLKEDEWHDLINKNELNLPWDFTPLKIVSEYLDETKGREELDSLMIMFFKHEVCNLQMRDLDNMSFVNQVEPRSPLVDRRILQFIFSIPISIRFLGKKLRGLMIKSLNDYFPPETLKRKKMSFIVPMQLWAQGPLKDFIDDILFNNGINKRFFLKNSKVNEIYNDFYITKKEKHPFKLWNLVVLEMWLKYHYDSKLVNPPTF